MHADIGVIPAKMNNVAVFLAHGILINRVG
jgi:hypothetical protein